MPASNQTSITMTYAIALFELAEERQALDAVLEDIQGLKSLETDYSDYLRFLDSPSISIHNKEISLERVFSQFVHPMTLQFLKVVCRKGRIASLPGILNDFETLNRGKHGVIMGKLTTAIELSDEELRQIADRIGQYAGKMVELEHRIDPDLIGGMTLEIEGTRIDGSVKNQLKRFTHYIVNQMQGQTDLAERFTL